MGAEVIKCEIPPMGDTLRNMTPFGYFFREQATSFVRPNPNKYWVGLDLHKPEAQAVFRELAAKADIIVENQRPGVMERWNVGYRQIKEINPGIIYISKTGFGQWGQYAMENQAFQRWRGPGFLRLCLDVKFPRAKAPQEPVIYL